MGLVRSLLSSLAGLWRHGLAGKAILGLIVLFVCGICASLANPGGQRPAAPPPIAVPALATNRPVDLPAATAVPFSTATPPTPRPTQTVRPVQRTAAPPTDAPAEPTIAAPAEATRGSSPVISSPGDAWYPCAQGQIKGNLNSMIYHVPGGASYAKTAANVQCFDTEAQAQAAGFTRAKR